jgi:hypothetical protein
MRDGKKQRRERINQLPPFLYLRDSSERCKWADQEDRTKQNKGAITSATEAENGDSYTQHTTTCSRSDGKHLPFQLIISKRKKASTMISSISDGEGTEQRTMDGIIRTFTRHMQNRYKASPIDEASWDVSSNYTRLSRPGLSTFSWVFFQGGVRGRGG